jgi:hypothetical protein
MRVGEQVAHTTSPHTRQWWRCRVSPKGALHRAHVTESLYGFQAPDVDLRTVFTRKRRRSPSRAIGTGICKKPGQQASSTTAHTVTARQLGGASVENLK